MGRVTAITDLEQLRPDRASATREARAGAGPDWSRATHRSLLAFLDPAFDASRALDNLDGIMGVRRTARRPVEASQAAELRAVDRAMGVARERRSPVQMHARTGAIQLSNLVPATAADVARAVR